MKDIYKQPTRKDVANLAGVSETVVSYVVNNNRYVASEKREKVLKAIEELNYKPNSIARALKGKSANHIIFIADQITNEHFGIIVQEMDRMAYNKGYLISLLSYRNDDDFVSQIISRHIDGVVISSTTMPESKIQEFVNANIPVVVLMNKNYNNIDKRVAKIYTGLKEGIADGVSYLVSKGKNKLAYIDRVSIHDNFSDMQDLRLLGFYEQMNNLGIKFDDNNIFTGFKTEEELFDAIRQRVIDGFNFNGIVARNDKLAYVAMLAVKSLGLKIPEDVYVIGFDNSVISKSVTPQLSTFEINRKEIGKAIIEILDEMIRSEKKATNIVKKFKAELIIRESIE